ncbi:MAG TPA: extracellular solute-binding protein [Candidatus Binatia bacterium]
MRKETLFINRINKGFLILLLGFCSITWSLNSMAESSQLSGQGEWDKALELAKKEGRVVVSITTSAELRAAIEKHFEKRFGVDVEPVVGRAPNVIRKMIEESKGGLRYVDVHVGGSESIITGLLPEGILEAVEPLMLLPEVKDTKQWWGGHVWADNAKKFVYSSLAHQSESLWYNPQVVRPEEVRSYDDFLDEKWENKIGLLDPRTPGSGASLWSYIREIKGEEYLKRLVARKLLINRDQRLLAENLARGKVSFVMGLGYYSYAPFLKAGLPVKPLPTLKEGTYISGGSGHLVALKNPPHPNAAKLFMNWFLSREGQDVYSRALGQGTRRLDVDTKWLRDIGIIAAKDIVTIDQYYKRENQSEDKINRLREPGAALARKLLD